MALTSALALLSGLAVSVQAQLPDPGATFDRARTALLVTDPQNDFLHPKGVAWGVVGKSVEANDTIANIETQHASWTISNKIHIQGETAMQIEQATSSTMTALWAELEPRVQHAPRLEDAAQALAAALHTHFQESVALARVYLTAPFEALPAANQAFVRSLAASAGAAEELRGSTPVLSLIGTHGQETAWNDRRNSQGHIGIPLISSAFVSAIPMIARLLHELGTPSNWIDSHDTNMLLQTIGQSTGLFFVDNAAEAVDTQGRKIIAAQDFVANYGVQSVFGVGGAYLDTGQILVIIVFCRQHVQRATAEHFLPLGSLMQSKTAALVEAQQIFAVG